MLWSCEICKSSSYGVVGRQARRAQRPYLVNVYVTLGNVCEMFKPSSYGVVGRQGRSTQRPYLVNVLLNWQMRCKMCKCQCNVGEESQVRGGREASPCPKGTANSPIRL